MLRSDGDIVAVGIGSDGPVLLALYTLTGALSSGFGSKGKVVDTSLVSSTSTPNSYGGQTTVRTSFNPSGAALEADDSIIVSGTYSTVTQVYNSSGGLVSSSAVSELSLVHYLASGARDLSFGGGTNGIVSLPIALTAGDLLIQPDGAIVAVGTATTGPNGYSDFLVARFNADGTPDTSFGGGVGFAFVDLGTDATGNSVALQPNGQVVAAGTVAETFGKTGHPLTWEFGTARLNSDGSLDTSFGTNGVAITPVGYSEVSGAATARDDR